MTRGPLDIRIDARMCRGAAECLYRAPRTFRLDAAGKAGVVDPRGDDEERVALAARACPNFAIRVWRGEERLA